MATSKQAPKKPSAKKHSTRRTSGKKRGSGSRRQSLVQSFVGALGWSAAKVSRELIGVVLLAVGLFFAAAFITDRGSFIGNAGFVAVTHLLGLAGAALAPLVALAGVLMLVGYNPGRRAVGAALILLGVSTTLASATPAGRRLEPYAYTESGGIIGSGLYSGVFWAGGSVGTIVLLGVLYATGLSLLTGISFHAVAVSTKNAVASSVAWLRGMKSGEAKEPPAPQKSERAKPGKPEEPRENGKRDRASPPEPASRADTEELEVVLPEQHKTDKLEKLPEQISGEYTPPPMSLLSPGRSNPEHDAEEVSHRLTNALADLGVEAQVVRAVVGPRVTRYELRLGSGVKVNKISNLQHDIAYALAATEVRILAPIPGKSAVGVEVPNPRPAKVTLGDVFGEYPVANEWTLPVGLGKDISGRAVFFDLAEMPHLLVAGTTGAGKSVMLNSLLTSLLLTTDPRRVKMVLVDPKRVELSQFQRVPHLITPVVTDVKKAANALTWAVMEMERRYEVLEKAGVRSLDGYNERAETPMPYVVVVIDELADLMMAAASKVEDAVIRLAQKARAVGIHLVVATQRPSVDVITGMIKANIPSRIAFAVSSQVDSRVILDGPGAEALLGSGDMLFKPITALRSSRIQGAFITEGEVDAVVSATTDRAEAQYVEEVTEHRESRKEQESEPEDELLQEAAQFVVSTQQASVSAVQRRFRVGYSRAGRIVDALERHGVVGPYEGSKSRAVVATELDLNNIFGDGEQESEEGSRNAGGGEANEG